MGRRVEGFGKILSAIVKSVFFSGVIFIIFFSIVTGGFPPDFRKLKKAFGNAQELAKVSHEQIQIAPLTGEGLFSPDIHIEEEEIITPLRSISSVPQDDLKAQLIDMQQEIFRLQQRVSELEEQASKSKRQRK